MKALHGAAIIAAYVVGFFSVLWLTVKNFTFFRNIVSMLSGVNIIQIMRDIEV